jgi:predicted DNA-binding transcriptional regulator AlpA
MSYNAVHSMTPPLPLRLDDDRIITLRDVASISGVSLATLRREVDAGRGPRITRISERRVGVRASHLREWLDSLEVTTV